MVIYLSVYDVGMLFFLILGEINPVNTVTELYSVIILPYGWIRVELY